MKSRVRILTAVCVLAVAGVWLLRPHRAAKTEAGASGSNSVTAAAAKGPRVTSTNANGTVANAKFPTLNTNKLAYRLSNTTNTIRELQARPHAILLANAFIDTDKSLDLQIPLHLQAKGDPGAYIVQARGTIDASFRAALSSAHAAIVSYIPNNAYLVKADAGEAAQLAGNPAVQAVLPYQPYYKLQSSLLGLAVDQKRLPPGTALTLGLFGSDPAAEAEIKKLGVAVLSRDKSPFGPVLKVLAPTDWTTLVQSPAVQFVEPLARRHTANDLSRVALGISDDTTSPITNGYAVNGKVLTGENVLVAVNDTGIDADHPDFSVGGTAQVPVSPPPTRIIGLTPLDLVDTNGHGTHVAGIIAGNGSQSLAPTDVGSFAQGSVPHADFRGKAPSARLFSVNDADYSDYELQTNAGWAGAPISNNSWDYGEGSSEYDLAAASYDFATRDSIPGLPGSQPVLFVFAAGNDGGGNDNGTGGSSDTILSPGTAKNVITVGALEQPRFITNIVTTITPGEGTNAPTTNQVAYWQNETDSGDQVAWYSARGNVGIGTEGDNGRFKPDVLAPGSFVVSTSSQFNHQWDTNAYYNPTNVSASVYTYQVASTNNLAYYNVQVPENAVGVFISIYPNNLSPEPFPNLVIYAQQSGFPDPVGDPSAIDITTYNNSLVIPPGANNLTLPSIQGNGFSFAVGITNNSTVNFNLTVAVLVTNEVGDLYAQLHMMNDQLGGYYRYESGTSMAAAGVSGLLALIQDYFTNQLSLTPSPAMLKALLVNGARSVGDYGLAFTNGINFQGWGIADIQTSVPYEGLFDKADNSTTGSTFFVDQSPANALATGDSHTYYVDLATNTSASSLYLQATLVWTDPPGDPAAAIKLVNSLELVVSNMDSADVVHYHSVYVGNDIQPDIGYNLPINTNALPPYDTVNNVQNVIIHPRLGLHYAVTVLGRSVNVNAVTAHTNNIVQDYALVIAVGEGEVTNAFTARDGGLTLNPLKDQNVTVVTSTNAPLAKQIVGASSPLLGTNMLSLGTNTQWGSSGVLTIGQTNQWHFYVVTNNGPTPDYTNAAFLTFGVSTLSIPRMGVYESTLDNATKPEANLNLFVSLDPNLTNLSPVVLSNCLAGANNCRAGLANAGTQFAFYTNSAPGQIYYIGVQSQDQMAAEYSFLPVFTQTPFSSLDQNGNEIVNGLMLHMPILQGNNAHPGLTNVFALAIMPMVVEKVTVTNLDEHQNFGDLLGTLSFGGQKAVLNNHDGFRNTIHDPPLPPIVYDDSVNAPRGTTNSDGPGSLTDFQALSAQGPWILSVLDNSAGGYTGQVRTLTLVIQPHRDLKQPGIIVAVPPGGWFYDWVDVPAGYTNLTFYGTNVTVPLPPGTTPIQMYERSGNDPTVFDYDQEATLTNGTPPGNLISVGPPLPMGRYFVGLYNPDQSITQSILLSATLGVNAAVNNIYNYGSGGATGLPDDAVTPAPAQTGGGTPSSPSTIQVPLGVTNLVASVNVGMVVDSPRISDYAFTLVSPNGQRVLLMENRGAGDTNGAGMKFVYTNILNATATGGAAADTNYLAVNPLGSTVPIIWNFYTVPDQMTVYSTTNPADFNPNSSFCLYNTDFASNSPVGAGSQDTVPFTTNLNIPSGITNITIVMNQFGNPYAGNGDAWTYTAGAPVTNYEYLMFTDDTNLANVPIKFARPPFNFASLSTNFVLSSFDRATNGNYYGPTNVNDGVNGGWQVPTNLVVNTIIVSNINGNLQFVTVSNVLLLTNNLVSVMTDPSTALTGDAGGSNYLALGKGTITRSVPTVPGRIYNVTFWYRGPGIEGWWRGEGNGNDSSDPENNNNNGTLIGRFNFPAGEVGQAFEFDDSGNTYQFAGTNTYVQVPASPSLNVGAAGGLTVEGWINPTNLTRPQPLVEWLAHVPTNTATADTNLSIVQGPVLDPATGHYYYLVGSTNWFISGTWAKQLGGDLATLETANEGQWIYDTFTAYGTLNRDLWIGLNDFPVAGTFHWTSGVTNLAYTNWIPGQPGSATVNDRFVAIMGPTNAYPGLWQLLDSTGRAGGNPPTNPVYGVVEVPEIPTNGVQFWISGTNWTPGETNVLAGCLYANLVDTNGTSHEIFSAPGLLTSNVYQHVALTYNTNSGIAALYLNGTNVATTNLGVFVPRTDGDMLLGWDMSRYTNNFYGGEMDEMSIYSRALSLAEISAIYKVSALTTNRLVGKFDPSVTPAIGLAEAVVTFGSSSNVIFGVNNQWKLNSFTFTATSNSMPLTISGVAPGILLDAFTVQEAPQTNRYYFPEQELSSLNGTPAAGDWTLQVWDSRAGAYVSAVDQLVHWELSFVLVSNALISATLPPETPVTTTVAPGQTVFYAVPVPVWANWATNIVVSATLPVDLFYYAPANPPTTATAPTSTLLTSVTSGTSAPIDVTPTPPATQFGTYYLGVRNSGTHAANVNLEVDYDVLGLTNGVPFTDVLTNRFSGQRYFSFDVSSNAYEATFQLLQLSGNADLVVHKGGPLPDLNNDTYGSFNNGTADENIYVLTNSSPIPLSAGRWYLGVLNRGSSPVQYSVLAKELDVNGLALPNSIMPAIINLTNGVPFTWTAGPGAALTNFFRFAASNSVVNGTNIFLYGLRFELFNLSGNGDLTLQSNSLPLAPPFYQSSQNGGTSPELIFVFTNNVQTNLAGDWYLGVPNREVTNISYTIVAQILTNLYFPAFPGAEGAGGGAIGGRFSDVYHVISTGDSGPGTLRDAVATAATNRTIVFDVGGVIGLGSPLVITNSYLTIAGETAPGGGITVAGDMTTVTNAHDIIVRYVRFRRGAPDDSFQFINSSNVIADHISAEWTSDNLVSVLNSTNVTIQWSVLADSLYGGGVGLSNAPTGSLLRQGAGAVTFHHNLYADNFIGSPRLGDNLTLDFVNNVVYNWGLFSGLSDGAADLADFSPDGLTNRLNYVGNYLIAGADTAGFGTNCSITNIAFFGGLTNAMVANWIFQTNNFIDSDTNGLLNGANTGWGMFTNDYTRFSRAFSFPAVSVDEAYVAYERVLDFAGVSLTQRDAVDTNIINGVRHQTGRLISSPPNSSMVAWWKAEGNGLDGVAGNNGNLVGGLAFTSGEAGQAFNFVGTNGYVLVPATTRLNLGTNNGFTVEEWIKPSDAVNPMPLFGWGTNSGSAAIGGAPSGSILAGPIQNPNNGHYYYFLQNNSWTASEALAEQLGGHLATIRSSGENLWVSNTFAYFGGVARTLWIGLYDPSADSGGGHAGNFRWVDGEPLTYQNWAGGEPNNCSGQEFYGMVYAPYPASDAVVACRWNDVGNTAVNCGSPGSLTVYGVAEVIGSAPYLWTSVGVSGNLYANLLDSTNGAHALFSGGNIIQSNVYQHVAWTYNTNTGIATLYLNGAVVASTNLGSFVPNTAGDVYLGKRVDGVPAHIYSGGMDEVTIYKRALSQNEIQAIFLAGSAGKSQSLYAAGAPVLPYLDTDQDGIPNFWEYTFTGAPYVPGNNQDRDGDGYTDLEEYENWVSGPHALTVTNRPVGLDLYSLCGGSGRLAFFATNCVHGQVYLTNVLGSVTNYSLGWSNIFAVFTPTNSASSGTNYSGFASFDLFVTNLDTAAYFGPVAVSIVVSAAPIEIDTQFLEPITPIVSGVLDPTNSGGSLFYSIDVPEGTSGAIFEIDHPSGPMAMVINDHLPRPSLSSYAYFTNAPPSPANLVVSVFTNSTPVPLHAGTWYVGAVNVAGPNSNVVYDVKVTLLGAVQPPRFSYPTNGLVTNILETVPFSLSSVANDLDTPSLPLSFAKVSGPTNLSISPTGVISWTPGEDQGPSTNSVQVSVSNGAFSVTNSFSIVVLESNLPPLLPVIPNQIVLMPGILVVTNAAADADLPKNPFGYSLTTSVTGPNQPVINSDGIITWTPSSAQSGASYLFTTVVTDTNVYAVDAQSLSATNWFYVSVFPPLPPGGPDTNVVNPGGINWFVVDIPKKADMATNVLLFATGPVNLWFSSNTPPSITNLPADVKLLANSMGGTNVITTTSTPALVPGGRYFLGIENPNSTAVTNAVQVTFHYGLPEISNFSIVHTNLAGTNGFLIRWSAQTNEQFHLQWSPRLQPGNWADFNGVISYSTFVTATNSKFQYFDDGSQTGGFGATRYYRLIWLDSPTNTAPFFLHPPDVFYAPPSIPFTYTNSAADWDLPAQTLAYLVSGTLVGTNALTIDSKGLISWTPSQQQLGLTNVITTTVVDSGTPSGLATNSFAVVVGTNTLAPGFTSITVNSGGVTFHWTAPSSAKFQIRWTTNLAPANWQIFPNVITSGSTNFSFIDTNAPLQLMKFYQLILLP